MKVAVTSPDGTSQYGVWMRSLPTIDADHHDPNCSGCPICSESARQTLRTMSALVDGPPEPPDTIAAIRRRGNPFVPSQYALNAPFLAQSTAEQTSLRTAAESGCAPSLTHDDFVSAIKRSRGMV